MNACHLHADKSVLTPLVVLCAPVMLVTYWAAMEVHVLVCIHNGDLYVHVTEIELNSFTMKCIVCKHKF